jgi:hypothetical protein
MAARAQHFRYLETAFEAGSVSIFAKLFVIVEISAQLFDNLVGRNEVIRQTLSNNRSDY